VVGSEGRMRPSYFLTLEGQDAYAGLTIQDLKNRIANAERVKGSSFGNRARYEQEIRALQAELYEREAPIRAAAAKAAEEALKVKTTHEARMYDPLDAAHTGPSIWSVYGLGYNLDLMGDDGELGGFFSRLKKAFTPPAAIRKAVARVGSSVANIPVGISRVARQATAWVPKPIKTAARLYGAGMMTMYTGGFAAGKQNKMFGLSAKEQKWFNQINKAARVISVTCATAGVGKILGVTAKMQGLMGPKALGGLKGTLPTFGKDIFLKEGGKLLIKDALKKGVWEIAKGSLGQVVAGFIPQSQAGETYNDLQDGVPTPLPTPDNAQVYDQSPAPVAGSSSMGPGGEERPPTTYGGGEEDGDSMRDAMAENGTAPGPDDTGKMPTGSPDGASSMPIILVGAGLLALGILAYQAKEKRK
jgi:hypothetical protein